MIKELLKFIVLSGLLFGGHYFFSLEYPQLGHSSLVILTQTILSLLFIQSHILTIVLSKKFKIMVGMLFLIFSVVKFISGGLFVFYLKKTEMYEINNGFIIAFMMSYFAFLTLDVHVLVKRVAQEDPQAMK